MAAKRKKKVPFPKVVYVMQYEDCDDDPYYVVEENLDDIAIEQRVAIYELKETKSLKITKELV